MPPDRSTTQDQRMEEYPSLKQDADETNSKKQTARRRAYAKRSCLKCREKKARCELPEQSLTTPSSMTPLSHELACHRCKVLSLDCVVWDGDRKRRPKVSGALPNPPTASSSTSIKPEPGAPRLPSSPPRSPGSLEQLAAAAARLSDQRGTYSDAPDMSPHGASTEASSTREAASTLASVQFFNPIVDDAASPMSAPSPSSVRAHNHSRLASNSSARDYAGSPLNGKGHRPASVASPSTASSATPAKAQPPGRTWTSLWRPLSVLIDYAAQQPSFTTYLLCRIDPNIKNLDILQLIPRQTLSHLKLFLKPYLLWHPHLPSLDQMYAEHRRRPTVSSALLLSSMCLIACRHAMPLTDSLPIKLSTLVDQLGTQILLSTPRDMYTVQALELLLAHEPSLVGTSVAGSAQAERGNGLLGESLLAAALTIARGLDLDKSIDGVVDVCSRPAPTTDAQTEQRREHLAKHTAGACIWISLRIWEGHFSFVNSTVRPIELGDMVAKAEAVVAIDNDGCKIERMERDPFQSTEKRFPGLDEDSILRSAGRTGLVYRLKSMARFQDTIAGMYRILATANRPDEITPTRPMPTTAATRQDILDLIDNSTHQQMFWQAAKMQAFSPFASVRPALLLEDWATMESYSLQELLPCLAICACMTGELNRGFSANEMVEALRVDESFRDQSSIIAEKRDVETTNMLSVFHLFDRGLGYSQPDILNRSRSQSKTHRGALWIEATGAPLLLTTAFATDCCKTFLEKTACSLHGFDHLSKTVDMHIMMMVNTIRRLEECDRNEYLPPIQGERTSMAPPSRRLMSLTPDLTDSKFEGMSGKSISQIGVMFIEEMAQVMQKWKLGVSLQRPVPLQFRHILGKHPSGKPTLGAKDQQRSTGPVSAQSSKAGTQLQHVSKVRSGAASAPSAAPSDGDDGSLSQAQSFLQSFQPNSAMSGLPQQSVPAATGGTNGGGNGGIFDLPMFELFEAASTTEWTNNVPWFDRMDNGVSAVSALAHIGNGINTPHFSQYQAAVPPLQNTWPSPQRARSGETLPPLQHPPSQPPHANHSHGYSYDGYPVHAPPAGPNTGFGQAYNDQGQSQAHSEPNGSHLSPHYSQHRGYYGGGSHHGGR